jgi:hypothetical protein
MSKSDLPGVAMILTRYRAIGKDVGCAALGFCVLKRLG